jgi:hypothetical protein
VVLVLTRSPFRTARRRDMELLQYISVLPEQQKLLETKGQLEEGAVDYQALHTAASPSFAVVTEFIDELRSFFTERARIEADYAKSLQKLSQSFLKKRVWPADPKFPAPDGLEHRCVLASHTTILIDLLPGLFPSLSILSRPLLLSIFLCYFAHFSCGCVAPSSSAGSSCSTKRLCKHGKARWPQMSSRTKSRNP